MFLYVLTIFQSFLVLNCFANLFEPWQLAEKAIHKRQAANNFEDSFCLQQCQQQLLSEIAVQRATGAVNSENSLERYCSVIYQPSVACFEGCRQTVYRDLSLAQLDIGKFLCIDNKIEAKKYYPCIESTTSKTALDVRCLLPCTNNGSYATYTILNPESKVSMNLNCRELRCNTKCQIFNVKQKCAIEGSRFVRDYYKYIVNTYQKQIDIIQGEGGKLWPQDCIDLQNDLTNDRL